MKYHAYQDSQDSPGACGYKEDGVTCYRVPQTNMHAVPAPLVESDRVPAAVAFAAHAEVVLTLVRKKDAAYGGAWQAQGYMGNLARIMSKTERLKNMLWRDDQFGPEPPVEGWDETIQDTLHDLMALAAFMASNIEEGNRWGTRPPQ